MEGNGKFDNPTKRKVFLKKNLILVFIELLLLVVIFYLRNHFEHIRQFLNHLIIINVHIFLFIFYDVWRIEKARLNSLIKIGVAYPSYSNENAKSINKQIKKILTELNKIKGLEYVSLLPLKENLTCSFSSAINYLKSNKENIESILWFDIDFENGNNLIKLSVRSGGLIYKSEINEILVHGVKVNLKNHIDFVEMPDSIKYISIDQFSAKKGQKQSFKDAIFYCLGIHSFLQKKLEASLRILNAMYPLETENIKSGLNGGGKYVKYRLTNNLITIKLRFILSSIYRQIVFEYGKKGDRYKGLLVCENAVKILGDSFPSVLILGHMVRISFELEYFDDARNHTLKLKEIVGRKTDEILLYEAFPALLAEDVDIFVDKFKRLRKELLPFPPEEMIFLFRDFRPKSSMQKVMIEYAICILTTYYIDKIEGGIAFLRFLENISDDILILKMKMHVMSVLDILDVKKLN